MRVVKNPMMISIGTDSFSIVATAPTLVVVSDAQGAFGCRGVGGSYMQGLAVSIDVRPLDEKPHAVSIGHFTHFLHIDEISKGPGGVGIGGGVSTQLASIVK